MALKKIVTPVFTEEEAFKLSKEYSDLSAQIKLMEEKKKFLADKLKVCAEKYGVKDDKGSYYLESDNFIVGKVARKSIKLDNDLAVSSLEALGLGDVIDFVKTVNEEKLEKAISESRLSIEDVKSFTKETVSYSVLVKEKQEMPEVDVSEVSVAKKKGKK